MEKKEKKKGWFQKLKDGLHKTNNWFSTLFNKDGINDDFYEELEEAMILADMGMETAERLLDGLRETVKAEKLTVRRRCARSTNAPPRSRTGSSKCSPAWNRTSAKAIF